MSGEKDLEQLKKEAVEKAKAAAAAKRAAKAAGSPAQELKPAPVESTVQAEQSVPAASDDGDLAKQKAAAAAKAKAAAAAKAKAAALAKQNGEVGDAAPEAGGTDEKAKAIAAAKAKAAAAAKAKAAALAKQNGEVGDAAPEAGGTDEKAKAIAAAKAKAAAAAKARAAAAAKSGEEATTDSVPVEPSPNQPFLDKYLKVIEEHFGKDALEDYYINKLSKDVPTLIIKKDVYFKIAQFLKYNELLSFDYLSELHATDYQTHMEMYVHLYSYKNRQSVALKVKIDRDQPTIESLQPIWPGADWPECEAYDLLGIKFTGHPNLHRIMLGEDWVGYPLRKDYEQYDVEV